MLSLINKTFCSTTNWWTKIEIYDVHRDIQYIERAITVKTLKQKFSCWNTSSTIYWNILKLLSNLLEMIIHMVSHFCTTIWWLTWLCTILSTRGCDVFDKNTSSVLTPPLSYKSRTGVGKVQSAGQIRPGGGDFSI